MPEQDYRLVGVRSNIDRLSASVVHRLYEDMIYRSIHAGEDWLRIVVPKGRTLAMERHIGVDGPHDELDTISAALGIPRIESAENRMSSNPSPDFFSPMPGGEDSRDYPLFTDRGTGMFGPAHAPIHSHTGGAMRFEDAAGAVLFRRQVAGQPGKHFMLDTYEQIRRVSMPIEAERFRERVQHLYADPSPI